MYNQSLKRYEATDNTGRYNWITEDLDPEDYKNANMFDLFLWTADVIGNCELDDLQSDVYDRLYDETFPRFGYTTAQGFNSLDEYLDFKKAEIRQDYSEEGFYVFQYLKSWVKGN